MNFVQFVYCISHFYLVIYRQGKGDTNEVKKEKVKSKEKTIRVVWKENSYNGEEKEIDDLNFMVTDRRRKGLWDTMDQKMVVGSLNGFRNVTFCNRIFSKTQVYLTYEIWMNGLVLEKVLEEYRRCIIEYRKERLFKMMDFKSEQK